MIPICLLVEENLGETQVNRVEDTKAAGTARVPKTQDKLNPETKPTPDTCIRAPPSSSP